ncbi:diguanylate phosphodiesterase [Erwinia psidii]|uniref:Diguanylate phosphodiesterase n=1 Tax=Erwinia psidii TaxID=69224 RepID=A0A3N6SI18_9GAMM|nr:diguanylate phosphodiesterase [Erwinia psidii]MCX8957590.1 diguanylate phosphodiesterase [Erwinia psidii]MCX8960644.1 diguanylate phosphodiesterase [Erwinia psidii]MCX8964111.1 diguanylate phosphodiesterase [Erwinia psidii]RQM39593.1 diguanylate phosphodiesterase [Erwinia psidii]
MLTTIIYRSHISDFVPIRALPGMVGAASMLNASHDVTGILLFNGTHFFQLLEGPEQGVLTVYQRICRDRRHHNVVELMRDYAPFRRFGNTGMELFDLREHERSSVLQAVLNKGTSKYQLTYDDRALKFLRTFVESREKENYYEVQPSELWEFIPDWHSSPCPVSANLTLRPVVDPMARVITAIEMAIPHADSSVKQGSGIAHTGMQAFKQALAETGKIFPPGMTLHISQLPVSLLVMPEAVRTLVSEIEMAGLVPEQVVIGVSETDVIPDSDIFSETVRALKGVGISLSLDDFGRGSAGLSLLTHIQPDRIRIDASITADVHRSGPRQAVVQAIIKCCSALEILVTVAGITRAEEWMWLEAAGIIHFQGELFTSDENGPSQAVTWPEFRETLQP